MEHTVPRYFFHINDGEDSPDTEGTDLADERAAHAQALATAGAILKEKGEESWDGSEWRMIVTDETGHVVCDLHFSARCTE
jgi:hypothetical protein